MSLENGTYIIRSKRSEQHVGRHPVEDRSLLPKRVLTLPEHIQAPKWVFEKKEDGNVLRVNGSPTAVIDDALFGILLETPEPTTWVIRSAGPENFYTISEKNSPREWVVENDEPEQQIKVLPKGLVGEPNANLFEVIRLDRS